MRKKKEVEETSQAVNATLIGSIAKSFSELSLENKGVVLGFTTGRALTGKEASETAANAALIEDVTKKFAGLSPERKKIVLDFTDGLILAGQHDDRARA